MKCESAQNYKLVGISEFGSRVGETHHRAKLTDHDVDLIRELREDHGLTYQCLAEKFECSKSTIRDICRYRRRWQRPDRWKKVALTDERTENPVDK
jgi:antitoxin component HigA of HigAB toxin-antitoxin module